MNGRFLWDSLSLFHRTSMFHNLYDSPTGRHLGQVRGLIFEVRFRGRFRCRVLCMKSSGSEKWLNSIRKVRALTPTDTDFVMIDK